MQSLNSLQFDRSGQNNIQETVSINKQVQDNDLSSCQLLDLRKNDAPSPDNISHHDSIAKAFQKLIVSFHIASFVKKLQRYLKPDNQFKERHFYLIGDKAGGNIKDFFAYIGIKSKKVSLNLANIDELSFTLKIRYKLRQWQKSINNKAMQLFDQLPLLDPNNKFKLSLDILINFFRIYLIYLIPIVLAFEQQLLELDSHLQIASFVYLLDMMLRCVTIYYDQGLPVRDRYQILKNQYSYTTLCELASILVIFVFSAQDYDFKDKFLLFEGWPKLLLLLYFFQINNLLTFINSWQQALSLGKAVTSMIELMKLIGLILIIQHLCSCIWLIIGQYQLILNNNNWITSKSLNNITWYELYLESLYFIGVTMFTVGYGDIYPENNYEKIFTLLFMFLCTLQLSYSVNTIGNILTQITKNNETIKKKFTFINQYMHNKNISDKLQFQVREYLNYYWYQEKIQQTKEQTEILGQLSEELRKAIAIESNSAVMKNCKFFENFSKEFNTELLQHLHFVTYQPQTIINIAKDQEFTINIIESGEVNVLEKRSQSINNIDIGTLQPGQSFGIDGFLKNEISDRLVYKSAGFVSVLVINLSLFKKILYRFPLDFETYWNLKSNYNDKFCASCRSSRHNSENCRQLHFIPDDEKVIKKYVFNQVQKRNFFIRNRNRQKHFFNAHADQACCTEAANLLRLGNDSDVFLKWSHSNEDSTQNESQATQPQKIECDSIQLLIKQFESQTELPPPKTEQLMKTTSHKFLEEYNCLNVLQQKLRYKQQYSTIDIEQIEETIRKLQIKLNERESILNFESHKEYTNFNPRSNISSILKKAFSSTRKIVYQTSKSYDQFQLNNVSFWLKYMYFPMEFFNQYRAIHRTQHDTEKLSIVKLQQMRKSNDLNKKRNHKRYIRRALQVFPIN